MEGTPDPASPAPLLTFAALHAHFATLPDPRRPQGRRFPLAALLTLAVAAILANHLSVLAIAEWGAAQCDDSRRALGFTGVTMPHQTTLHRVFARLDAHRLATMLTHALTETAVGASVRGQQGVAVDGKAQRGRLAGQPLIACPIHLLSAVCHDTGLVLAQLPVTASGDKPAAELATAPALIAHLDWPAVAPVCMVERVWQERGVTRVAVKYAITSLPPTVADAARLLTLKREHWQIENGLHHVKDVTLGEDASMIRRGQGPNVVAMLRDTAPNLLRATGCRTIAARLRHHCRHPDALLAFLGLPLPQHA